MKAIDISEIAISKATDIEEINECLFLLVTNSGYADYSLRVSMVIDLMGLIATGGTLLMAKHGGQLVGVLASSPKSFEDKFFEVVRIKRIAVIKQFRRCGIGRKLVDLTASTFGRIDAVTETKSACEFFSRIMPISARLKGGASPLERSIFKKEGLQMKNMRLYSNCKIGISANHAESIPDFSAAIAAKKFIDCLDYFLLEQG